MGRLEQKIRKSDTSIEFLDPKLRENLKAIESFISTVGNLYNISDDELIRTLLKRNQDRKETAIPSTILQNRNLGVLEIICKYLKENCSHSFKDIASMLSRDQRVVWMSYNSARKKMKELFFIGDPKVWVPVKALNEKNLGMLQLICRYLKDNLGLSYHEIAVLLNRDDRTIWTAYNKAKKDGN